MGDGIENVGFGGREEGFVEDEAFLLVEDGLKGLDFRLDGLKVTLLLFFIYLGRGEQLIVVGECW